MRLRIGVTLGLTVAMLASVMACEDVLGHGCTEIGCSDNAHIEAAFSDHAWPAGAYRLELQVNELTRVCTFNFPALHPTQGEIVRVLCEPADPQFSVSMEQGFICHETRTADAVSQSCDRIDGQYSLQIEIIGTPRSVQLRLERDAVLVSQHDLTLSYVASRPNGPDCEPLCRQSSFKLQLD